MTVIDGYIIVLPALIAGIVLIILSIVKKRRGLRVGLDAVFIAYCACVIGILYFPLTINSDEPFVMSSIIIDWIPFRGVYRYFVQDNSLRGFIEVVYNTVGNLFLFVPLSAYLTWTRSDKFRQNLLIVAFTGGFAEILQLIIIVIARAPIRTIDITDLILNCCGACISLLIFRKILIPFPDQAATAMPTSTEH